MIIGTLKKDFTSHDNFFVTFFDNSCEVLFLEYNVFLQSIQRK